MTRPLPRRRFPRIAAMGLIAFAVAAASFGQTRFVRFDLVTPDADRALDFYEAVFGWSGTQQTENWTLLTTGEGVRVGGIFSDEDGEDSIWVGQLLVADVAAAAEHFEELGGKKLFGPNQIEDGRLIAVFEDEEGAVIGLTDDATGESDGIHFDAWVWAELWSTDPPGAVKTYRQLGGFEIDVDLDPNDGVRHVLSSAGKPRAGIVSKPFAEVEPHWLPYVLVGDLDEVMSAAREAGGSVAMEPLPGEHGRSTILVDPTGAGIGVFEATKRALDEAMENES